MRWEANKAVPRTQGTNAALWRRIRASGQAPLYCHGGNPRVGGLAVLCAVAVLTLGHGTVFAGLLIGLYIGKNMGGPADNAGPDQS